MTKGLRPVWLGCVGARQGCCGGWGIPRRDDVQPMKLISRLIRRSPLLSRAKRKSPVEELLKRRDNSVLLHVPAFKRDQLCVHSGAACRNACRRRERCSFTSLCSVRAPGKWAFSLVSRISSGIVEKKSSCAGSASRDQDECPVVRPRRVDIGNRDKWLRHQKPSWATTRQAKLITMPCCGRKHGPSTPCSAAGSGQLNGDRHSRTLAQQR